jgi:hypothetical protein
MTALRGRLMQSKMLSGDNVRLAATPVDPTRPTADSSRSIVASSLTFRARRIHRWLGLCIGIQFALWTIGGLYFSWADLDAVHGDHLLRGARPVAAADATVSPAQALAALREIARVDSVASLELVHIAERPTYRLRYFGAPAAATHSPVHHGLVDAATGRVRAALSQEEAIATAKAAYAGTAPVSGVSLLTADSVSPHHEFREQPLPAWAVRFGDDEGATAYVPVELGEVLRIRNNRWRVFDFLWMLHTMDYQGRDDFNNLLLRTFSILGLLMVTSGFILFGLTSPTLRRRRGAATVRPIPSVRPSDVGV